MPIKLKKDYSQDNIQKGSAKVENSGGEETLKELLRENLELTKEMYQMLKSVKSYVFWARIGGFLKIILIVVPLIAGIIFLPPLLKNVFKQYEDLLGINGDLSDNFKIKNILNSAAPQEITPDVKKQLEEYLKK